MCSGRHFALAWHRLLGLYWKGLIAVKGPSVAPWYSGQGGKMWGLGEGGRQWYLGEVLSGRDIIAPSKEGRVGRISQKEYWRICMGRLRCSRNWPSLHLPPSQHQPVHHSQKATTPAPIKVPFGFNVLCVYICKSRFVPFFSFFLFFLFCSAGLFDQVNREQCINALFIGPTNSTFQSLFH